MSKQEPL